MNQSKKNLQRNGLKPIRRFNYSDAIEPMQLRIHVAARNIDGRKSRAGKKMAELFTVITARALLSADGKYLPRNSRDREDLTLAIISVFHLFEFSAREHVRARVHMCASTCPT